MGISILICSKSGTVNLIKINFRFFLNLEIKIERIASTGLKLFFFGFFQQKKLDQVSAL